MADTRRGFQRATRLAFVVCAAVSMCLALMPLAPTVASELPADPEGQPDPSTQIRRSGARLQVSMPATASQHVWVWSAGARAFYLDGRDTNKGYTSLLAVDLETGQSAGSVSLAAHGYRPPEPAFGGAGLDRTMAIDEAGGRIFLATTGTADVLNADVSVASRTTQGQACVAAAGPGSQFMCLTGFSVLDASTLQRIRHVPLRSVQIDGGLLAPQLLAMEYAPPREALTAKMHLLVQDGATSTYATDGSQGRYNPRNVHNLTYLVQLDPETGTQDWAVRLDGCRGAMAGRTTTEQKTLNNFPHQAALFRGGAAGAFAVFVACHSSSQVFTGSMVRVPLNEQGMATVSVVPRVPDVPEGEPAPGEVPPGTPLQAPAFERPYTVDGPDYVYQMVADPDSGRVAMQVIDGRPLAMVWYVFDTAVMQFVGTIGIGGPVQLRDVLSTVSRDHGRLYTLLPPSSSQGRDFAGGLFVADIRRTPLPQALHFPGLADQFPPRGAVIGSEGALYRWALVPQALGDGTTRLWMPEELTEKAKSGYVAIDDHRPVEAPVPPVDSEGRTLDLDEEEGITTSTLDGAARGFGFRMLLVGGAEAAARMGSADPVGLAAQCNDADWSSELSDPWHVSSSQFDFAMNQLEGRQGSSPRGPCYRARTPLPTQCADATREAVLAFVGPRDAAVVDGAGARGAAEPFLVDATTTTDSAAPLSRCVDQEWEELWGTALFGRAPAGEPSASDSVGRLRMLAECTSASDRTSARTGDAVSDGYSAQVNCEQEEASGHAYARVAGVGDVTVAEALASFRIYRDPGRGVVSRVESAARGISIGGVIRIDTVRGVAESWANGRAFAAPELAGDESYDPNCDFDRTAGTCFQRHLFGVSTPGYGCGPCGDEQAFVEGMNAVLNPNASVRLREPDARLRIGAENGFMAAVQKPEHERFADLALNNDVMQTTLPVLEIIRQAPANRPASRLGPRGRQIYQFAGVEVSSSYGIQCLLVYDEATNTCAGEKQEPGAITVSLSDADGKPLAGGAFEMRQDVDADGVLGLKDTLLANGACVTAEDGVGTCKLDNLQPGGYLVSQVAAPPGYAQSAEPFVVELASGERRTVAFTNVSNLSTVDVKATDENGAPLSGAVFAAYPDPDSDGKVAPEAKPSAECTTDGQGVCQMKVPAGSYVLVQTSAPGGLEGIEPVAFTFASGGQVASVSVVNYQPDSPAAPEAPASPIYTPPVDMAPPAEIVDDSYVAPTDTGVDLAPDPEVGLPARVTDTVTQVVRAPGDALRLFARDPKQAVAWTAALALFVLAAMAVGRRQQALAIIAESLDP